MQQKKSRSLYSLPIILNLGLELIKNALVSHYLLTNIIITYVCDCVNKKNTIEKQSVFYVFFKKIFRKENHYCSLGGPRGIWTHDTGFAIQRLKPNLATGP